MKGHRGSIICILIIAMLIIMGCSSEPVEVTSVSLNKTEIALNPEDTYKLKATTSPSDAAVGTSLEWTSNEPGTAAVDNSGNVTAKTPGEAVITVTTGNGKKAECKVKVSPVEATLIALNHKTLEMTINSNPVDLAVTFTPENTTDKTIIWESSAPLTVKVQNGRVSALKEGEATITARAGILEAECKVTVKPVEATDIYFIDSTYVMEKDATMIEDGLRFTPHNTKDKSATWSSSDENVVRMNEDGTFQCLKTGTATITATHGKLSATCTFEVVDHVNCTAGKLWEELKAKGIEKDKSLRIAGNISGADFNGLIYTSNTLKKLDIGPVNVKDGRLDGKAGADNTCLETLILPYTLAEIPEAFVSDNSTITSVTLPKSVRIIKKRAFQNLDNLTDIILPEGLQEIEEAAFHGTGLTNIVIPSTVTSMTDDWPALESVTFKSTTAPALIISTGSSNAPKPPNRDWMPAAKAYVPEGSVEEYKKSAWCSGGHYVEHGIQPCFNKNNIIPMTM